MAGPIKIACRIPNGVTLQLSERRSNGLFDEMVQVGEPVAISGPSAGAEVGITEIDPSFWSKWIEQNKGSALIASGALAGPDIEKAPAEVPPAEQASERASRRRGQK